MKKKFIVFFVLFFIMILSYNKNNTNNLLTIEKEETIEQSTKENPIIVAVNYQNDTKNLYLEDYVFGVVSCEMPASFEFEALKAMAVASRTFALYKLESNKDYILSSTTSDQCYSSNDKLKSRWKDKYDENYNKIKKAVDETRGKYITYNDKAIYAAYFSISNGYTENSEDVFVKKLSYLKSVSSSWDEKYSYKSYNKEIKIVDFLNKLGINDNKIKDIKIERGPHGRVDTITINNHKYKGTKFRTLLSLRSTDFEIKETKDKVIIHTKGYGHGVGMSQYGANGMALEGYNYIDIINHYYTGVKIMNK